METRPLSGTEQLDYSTDTDATGVTVWETLQLGEFTVRVRVRVDAYRNRSYAMGEVLTPALTWTHLVTHPLSAWWEQGLHAEGTPGGLVQAVVQRLEKVLAAV